MLTVLHVSPVWLPLTQSWMHAQVSALPARVTAHVVCLSAENLDQFRPERLHALEAEPPARRLWEKALVRLRIRPPFGYVATVARRAGAQILHSHFGDQGWICRRVARRARLRHVTTFYGYDVGYLPTTAPIWRARYRQLFADVDRVLAEGTRMAASLEALGCPRDKLRVHHLGVRLDRIAFRPRRWCPGGPLKVLLAASFREKKGLPLAIEALGHLRDEVALEITLIGDAGQDPRDQRERQRILAAIAASGLGERVRLAGYRPHGELLEEAYRHHLFLHPSRTASDGDSEGGVPVSLLEMAASGMPVVSTTHCDIPEVIEHGVSGMLAPEGDVGGLVACLRALVQARQRWEEMARAARAHLEREYDAARQGERLADLYQEVVGS